MAIESPPHTHTAYPKILHITNRRREEQVHESLKAIEGNDEPQ